MRKQEPLLKASDVIIAAVRGQDDLGYAGVELGDGKVIVWWHGSVPKSVEPALRAAGRHAGIEIRPAPYSEKQLEAAGRQLETRSGLPAGGPVHAILLPSDGSGLRALVAPGTTTQRRQEIADIGVPLDVQEKRPFEPTSRCADGSPWKGGAGYVNASRNFTGVACDDVPQEKHDCSTAFGVKNPAGARYLLTARHCGMVGDSMRNAAGVTIGRAAVGNKSQDVLLIAAPPAYTIYDGAGTSLSVRTVTGWGNAPTNTALCTSGATTGTLCNHTVDKYRVKTWYRTDFDGSSVTMYDFSLADHTCPGVEGGDSGGAVFSRSGSNVTARGVINAQYDEDGDGCKEDLLFMDFGRLREATGFEGITPL